MSNVAVRVAVLNERVYRARIDLCKNSIGSPGPTGACSPCLGAFLERLPFLGEEVLGNEDELIDNLCDEWRVDLLHELRVRKRVLDTERFAGIDGFLDNHVDLKGPVFRPAGERDLQLARGPVELPVDPHALGRSIR